VLCWVCCGYASTQDDLMLLFMTTTQCTTDLWQCL
jgi:hypothetical protein